MSDFSERDRELLAKFGMTEKQVKDDADRMESETAGHGITGPVYYGLHMIPDHDSDPMMDVPAVRRVANR